MTADPLQYLVVGEASQSVVVAPVLLSIPGLGNFLSDRTVDVSTSTVSHYPRHFTYKLPNEVSGTDATLAPLCLDVPVSDTSPLGTFRGEVFDSPAPYAYNGNPGTKLPAQYQGWRIPTYTYERFNLGVTDAKTYVDLYATNAVLYTGVPHPEVNAEQGFGDYPLIPYAFEFSPTTHAAFENPLVNPNIGGGGGGSERPEEGLLYPRKV